MSDLKEILAQTVFRQIPGNYIYAKLKSVPDNPREHFLVSFDEDEVTVVTKVENYEKLKAVERNKDQYALIELRVSIPFYSVGFLASVSTAIASKSMNVLIVSTYSKDYILIKTDKTHLAKESLEELGMKEA